jgi:hypothetical protein
MNHIAVNDAFRAGLASLEDIADALPEICKRCPDLPQSVSELFRIKNDSFLAIGTGDLVITLEPTERLIELVAAARTWKRISGFGQESREVGSGCER